MNISLKSPWLSLSVWDPNFGLSCVVILSFLTSHASTSHSQARDRGEGAERAGRLADDPPPRFTRPRRQDIHGADRHHREPPAGPRHASATDSDPLASGGEARHDGERDKLVDSRMLAISEHKINLGTRMDV